MLPPPDHAVLSTLTLPTFQAAVASVEVEPVVPPPQGASLGGDPPQWASLEEALPSLRQAEVGLVCSRGVLCLPRPLGCFLFPYVSCFLLRAYTYPSPACLHTLRRSCSCRPQVGRPPMPGMGGGSKPPAKKWPTPGTHSLLYPWATVDCCMLLCAAVGCCAYRCSHATL